MGALTDLKNERARQEGHDAYYAQLPRHAPARFGVFAGKWVEGWDAAALDDFANSLNFLSRKDTEAVQSGPGNPPLRRT